MFCSLPVTVVGGRLEKSSFLIHRVAESGEMGKPEHFYEFDEKVVRCGWWESSQKEREKSEHMASKIWVSVQLAYIP